MKKTSETIIFFGSGPVASECLKLLTQNFIIEKVITKPKPAHHHGTLPVVDMATKLNLPFSTVAHRADLENLFTDTPPHSKLGILIDFGVIIPQKVIDIFPLGIANSHFSILPEWRGADPITFAILSGQQKTGVSLMLLVEEMDKGPLLAFGEYEISSKITTPQLTHDLIELSDVLLSSVIPEYLEGQVEPFPQLATGRNVSYSRKLVKEDGVINWDKRALQIEREIRAYVEWPKSQTKLGSIDLIVSEAHVVKNTISNEDNKTPVGSVLIDGVKRLSVVTSEDLLVIDRLKPANKPEMSAIAFLAGYSKRLTASE